VNRLVLLLVCVVIPSGWPLIAWTALTVHDRLRAAVDRRRMNGALIAEAERIVRTAARAERRRP
jgi:hypothetical protein